MNTRYHVHLLPQAHLFAVRLELDALPADDLQAVTLRMPVWIPGSYMVREYARHVQRVRAFDLQGRPLPVVQLDKTSWRVQAPGLEALRVLYEVYAHDINVRANHLDDSHGFFNGVSLFLMPVSRQHQPVALELELPSGWMAFTGLEPADDSGRRFLAQSFDELFDCPVELGPHHPLRFEACGVPHQIVFWGRPCLDLERLVQDTRAIVQANAALFDGVLPYARYTFIVLLAPGGRGGLEHRSSTVLLWDETQLRDAGPGSELKDGLPHGAYLNFLRLISHEHYHVWNVKRIRPQALGPFDYFAENYTRLLWAVEGITSYYEVVSLLRAGLITRDAFLAIMAQSLQDLEAVPGRALHSLEEASLNAWVKLYRPDEHTANSSVSYYLKGELVAFLLDARLRALTDGERGLDDVMRLLWARHQEDGQGYAEDAWPQLIAQATGQDLSAWLERHVASTQELDLEGALAPYGLRLERGPQPADRAPWAGVTLREEQGRAFLATVRSDGPALEAGLSPHDELLALDGRRVLASTWSKLLHLYAPGDVVTVTLARRGHLITRQLTLACSPPTAYALRPAPEQDAPKRALLARWLGPATAEATP